MVWFLVQGRPPGRENPPCNTTLPIALFDYLRFSFEPTASAVSTVSVAMSVLIVVLIQRLVGLESIYWGGRR